MPIFITTPPLSLTPLPSTPASQSGMVDLPQAPIFDPRSFIISSININTRFNSTTSNTLGSISSRFSSIHSWLLLQLDRQL